MAVNPLAWMTFGLASTPDGIGSAGDLEVEHSALNLEEG